MNDLNVFVKADLYEVDEAFWKRLKNVRHIPVDDLLRQATEATGYAEKGTLFDLLEKQKLLQTGAKVQADIGQETALLSRHKLVRCLPSPDQARRGEKARQTILPGVSFLAAVQVSPDRRVVRFKLTEKAADLQAIDRVKVWDDTGEKEVEADSVFLKESSHTQVLEVPDGATQFVAVHSRPRALQAKSRWWVLAITPRIVIEEEEKEYRQEKTLPRFLTDPITDLLTSALPASSWPPATFFGKRTPPETHPGAGPTRRGGDRICPWPS